MENFDDTDLDALANGLGEVDTGAGGTDTTPSDAVPADQPAADAEPQTLEQDLAAGLDTLEGAPADDTRKWDKEWRKLADQALEQAGVNPQERHQHGLSRRETTRRLFAGEAMLRQDLGQGLSAIIQSYGSNLEPAQRAAAVRAVVEASGYTLSSLGEAERSRLQAYDQQTAQHERQMRAAVPQAQRMLDDFKAKHADFDAHRDVMAAMIRAGRASTLEQAYELAALLTPTGFENRYQTRLDEQAKAADEARRSKVEAARRAGTPSTKSSPGRLATPPAESDKPIDQLLNEAYDAQVGG